MKALDNAPIVSYYTGVTNEQRTAHRQTDMNTAIRTKKSRAARFAKTVAATLNGWNKHSGRVSLDGTATAVVDHRQEGTASYLFCSPYGPATIDVVNDRINVTTYGPKRTFTPSQSPLGGPREAARFIAGIEQPKK